MRVVVYDLNGRLVRRISQRRMSPGVHELSWDGRDENGRAVGCGVYLCRLVAGSESRTGRMVLVR